MPESRPTPAPPPMKTGLFPPPSCEPTLAPTPAPSSGEERQQDLPPHLHVESPILEVEGPGDQLRSPVARVTSWPSSSVTLPGLPNRRGGVICATVPPPGRGDATPARRPPRAPDRPATQRRETVEHAIAGAQAVAGDDLPDPAASPPGPGGAEPPALNGGAGSGDRAARSVPPTERTPARGASRRRTSIATNPHRRRISHDHPPSRSDVPDRPARAIRRKNP